jgi:hypothetical protein
MRDEFNRARTPEEHKKRVQRIKNSLSKRKKMLEAAGIEYEFPSFSQVPQRAARKKDGGAPPQASTPAAQPTPSAKEPVEAPAAEKTPAPKARKRNASASPAPKPVSAAKKAKK